MYFWAETEMGSGSVDDLLTSASVSASVSALATTDPDSPEVRRGLVQQPFSNECLFRYNLGSANTY